jgi:DNA (cytosine-5)-methyltransferase 1
MALQKDRHTLTGGIEMGGLRLLTQALLRMGYAYTLVYVLFTMNDFIHSYQFQSSLLQAAHYGTPQHRVRYFGVAARDGLKLPELPQPTHDCSSFTTPLDFLQIRLPAPTSSKPSDDDQASKMAGDVIKPIRIQNGTAPHPMVTIKDAIGDLPNFDW